MSDVVVHVVKVPLDGDPASGVPNARGIARGDQTNARGIARGEEPNARGSPRDRAVLSRDELARADRFVFDRDSRLFVTAHAALRRILGAAVGVEPERLVFEREEHGRPRLVVKGGRGPSFSLSHSGDRALIAVGAGAQRLGVDVERFRDGIDIARFAARNFTPFERAEIAAAPPNGRQRAFFRVWTRKEAYVKALGKGLHQPLSSFDVTAGDEARLAALRDGERREEWSLHDLELGERRAGALAVHPRCARVRIELAP